MVVAMFLALGSTAYAVTQINGKNIIDGTVTGKKLARNTLTGREILESSLGRVPSAANAANAATVGTRSLCAGHAAHVEQHQRDRQ